MPLFSALGSALAPFVGPQGLPTDYTFAGQPGQVAGNEVSIPTHRCRPSIHAPSQRDGVWQRQPDQRRGAGPRANTSGVTMTNPTLVNGSAYAITITGVDTTSVPGTTTVTCDIAENPNVGGPIWQSWPAIPALHPPTLP